MPELHISINISKEATETVPAHVYSIAFELMAGIIILACKDYRITRRVTSTEEERKQVEQVCRLLANALMETAKNIS